MKLQAFVGEQYTLNLPGAGKFISGKQIAQMKDDPNFELFAVPVLEEVHYSLSFDPQRIAKIIRYCAHSPVEPGRLPINCLYNPHSEVIPGGWMSLASWDRGQKQIVERWTLLDKEFGFNHSFDGLSACESNAYLVKGELLDVHRHEAGSMLQEAQFLFADILKQAERRFAEIGVSFDRWYAHDTR